MRKHTVMLSALVAAFASFAAPFTDGGVTYTPNNEVSRYQPVVTGVNVTGMVESVAYTKGEVDRRIETNAPVRSVNGMRGNVKLGAREVGALPDNRAYLEDDANFVEAVRNVQIKKVTTDGGTARMLPKYLYAMEFSDSYTNDAAWYYDNHHDYGYCSVVRDGNIVSRNYDWRFDSTAEFVVLMSSGEGRFASVGVANCGTNLTDDIVSSGHWSRYFKCLPGRTVDGLNENGVFVCVNVYRDSFGWPESGTLHCNAAVRWVLDNATSAEQAANYVADNVYIPSEIASQTSFHWMIADSEGTWIVERRHATKITGYSKLPALSNYLVLIDASTVYYPERYADVGEGGERLMLLTNGGNITNAWFTNAYSPSTRWLTDFGTNEVVMSEAKRRWGLMPKESHRGESFLGYTWWQSLHTSVYDIGRKTLRIAVQEVDDWYSFAVPSAGGVKPEAVKEIVSPMVAAATNALDAAKRDKTDLDVKVNRRFVFIDGEKIELFRHEPPAAGTEEFRSADYDGETRGVVYFNDVIFPGIVSPDLTPEYWPPYTDRYYVFPGETQTIHDHVVTIPSGVFDGQDFRTDKLATRLVSATNALAKFDADGNLVAATADEDYSTLKLLPTATGGAGRRVNEMLVFPDGFRVGRNEEGMGPYQIEVEPGKIGMWDTWIGITAGSIYIDGEEVATKDDIPTVVAPDASATTGQAADAKSTNDALDKKADELGEWIPKDVPSGVTLIGQPTHNNYVWIWYCTGSDYTFDAEFTSEDDDNLTFIESGEPSRVFTASRKRVLRTGDAATPQELADAISTNNPSFVSAVRNTPTENMPSDMPTDWGTYGTVGAALAALAAGLKWCKNILGTLASGYSTFAAWIAAKADTVKLSDGSITKTASSGALELDDFFSESNSLLTGTIAAKSVTEYSSTLTYEVGEIVMRDGVAYKCVTAITTVEAWTAAHWTAATDAEIAARLKGFKDDGSVTDAFAAGLFGKQVAISAVQDIVNDMFDNGDTTAYPRTTGEG